LVVQFDEQNVLRLIEGAPVQHVPISRGDRTELRRDLPFERDEQPAAAGGAAEDQ